MAHERRPRPAVVTAALLAGGLALTTVGTAAASPSRPEAHGARAVVTTPSSERLAVSVDVSVAGQHVKLSLTGLVGATTAELHVVGAGASLEVRRIGSTIYVHVPPGTKKLALPAGKTWGRLTLSGIEQRLGIPLLGLSSAATSTLGAGALLKGLALLSTAPPRKVGTATIHGIATTAYRAEVELKKALGAVPTAEAAALDKLFGIGPQTTVPVTAWVSAPGRLVQIQAAVPLELSLAGAKLRVGLSVLAQTWDFGVPVHVSPPPASQVAPLPVPTLGGGALGLGGLSSLGSSLANGISRLGGSVGSGLGSLGGLTGLVVR